MRDITRLHRVALSLSLLRSANIHTHTRCFTLSLSLFLFSFSLSLYGLHSFPPALGQYGSRSCIRSPKSVRWKDRLGDELLALSDTVGLAMLRNGIRCRVGQMDGRFGSPPLQPWWEKGASDAFPREDPAVDQGRPPTTSIAFPPSGAMR